MYACLRMCDCMHICILVYLFVCLFACLFVCTYVRACVYIIFVHRSYALGIMAKKENNHCKMDEKN